MSLSGLFSKVSRHCLLRMPKSSFIGGITVRHSRIWEPDYLILAETKTPEYDTINVQLKGYDFAVLEKFQKKICKLAKCMKINVLKKFPVPQQDLEIHHYKSNSAEVKYNYNLKVCERNVQIVDVKSNVMPLFIEAVITACPPGINISFHNHEDSIEEDRYIPNYNIIELEEKLQNVGVEKKQKKKRS